MRQVPPAWYVALVVSGTPWISCLPQRKSSQRCKFERECAGGSASCSEFQGAPKTLWSVYMFKRLFLWGVTRGNEHQETNANPKREEEKIRTSPFRPEHQGLAAWLWDVLHMEVIMMMWTSTGASAKTCAKEESGQVFKYQAVLLSDSNVLVLWFHTFMPEAVAIPTKPSKASHPPECHHDNKAIPWNEGHNNTTSSHSQDTKAVTPVLHGHLCYQEWGSRQEHQTMIIPGGLLTQRRL